MVIGGEGIGSGSSLASGGGGSGRGPGWTYALKGVSHTTTLPPVTVPATSTFTETLGVSFLVE